MTEENSIPFAPFVAINEFMRPEFRLQIIDELYSKMNSLPADTRGKIDQLTRQHIHVQGFRNPAKAPARLRAKASVEAFEKHSDFAGELLFAWLALRGIIAIQVADLLGGMGWEGMLPLSADRRQLPGFMIQWPAGYDFNKIFQLYQERYPEDTTGTDEVSLVTVLVSMRLPYEEE